MRPLPEILATAERVEALSAAATQGPWSYDFGYNNGGMPTGFLKIPGHNQGATVEMLETDCRMITEGRTLSPALAADVRELAQRALELANERDKAKDLLRECLPFVQHLPGIADRARELGLFALPAADEPYHHAGWDEDSESEVPR